MSHSFTIPGVRKIPNTVIRGDAMYTCFECGSSSGSELCVRCLKNEIAVLIGREDCVHSNGTWDIVIT